ncbi:response regulator [Christiangramia forsetii]|uniref:Two-component system response regulator n=2 Tax=Christiangramia forsetii TaxID=411153 RepID=A0M4P6_CHRFK|nr:response regulator transcription factor [Christiangramia forsetii]GGG22957.1 DNA-binding response regulator [Christiangramia forsetii]CAL67591.1 two-component system response regulator [Christiangramia forsetii KT0803]
MIRLVIAEDHTALIDGIKVFFEYEEDIEFVGFANNGQELIELTRRKKPNLIITDIRMPVMDGIQATKEILEEFPNIKIIAFSMFDQDKAVQQMLEAGASGYILKNSSLKELLYAIRKVHEGEHYYDPNITVKQKSVSPKSKAVLTGRQREILKLIGQGRTNQEIADQLFIGKTTVETHRKNMIRKLGLQGAGELLRYALEKKYDF